MKPINTFSLLACGAVATMTVVGAGAFAPMAMADEVEVPPLAALGEPPIPADNPMSEAKIELGKMLFWDPRLGGDASTACVTCHEPDQGWAFSDSLSRGYPGTVHWRNSQSIIRHRLYSSSRTQATAMLSPP